MKFIEWSKKNTVQIRIRRDLRDYLKKVAKTRQVTMFYIINELILEKYLKYKKEKSEQKSISTK